MFHCQGRGHPNTAKRNATKMGHPANGWFYGRTFVFFVLPHKGVSCKKNTFEHLHSAPTIWQLASECNLFLPFAVLVHINDFEPNIPQKAIQSLKAILLIMYDFAPPQYWILAQASTLKANLETHSARTRKQVETSCNNVKKYVKPNQAQYWCKMRRQQNIAGARWIQLQKNQQLVCFLSICKTIWKQTCWIATIQPKHQDATRNIAETAVQHKHRNPTILLLTHQLYGIVHSIASTKSN